MNATEAIRERLCAATGPVRIVGSGSRARHLPARADATALDLSDLREIVRLDHGDQTCTVECGVPLATLDAALREHDLELPCLGGGTAEGTVGGLFACDPFGPGNEGGQSPRSLLLGLDAVLADGTVFKAGARVVKSVAGFDVHKLFVGSQGRLFVAARLHLRLKPRPRAEQWFTNDDLDEAAAFRLLHALRQEPLPLPVLQLRRDSDGSHAVMGRAAGRAGYVTGMVQRHGLHSVSAPTSFHLDPPPRGELLTGLAVPSALPELLRAVPATATFTWLGGGRFQVALPDPGASDRLLAALPNVPASGVLAVATGERHGRGTPIDPGQARLADALKIALDPDGTLV